MAKKPNRHARHIPQRTCVGCHEVLAKRTLIRIVRAPEGVLVDLTGKHAGRGAYLHNKRSCWERGLKGTLAHALKTELTPADFEQIKNYLATLPEDAPEDL